VLHQMMWEDKCTIRKPTIEIVRERDSFHFSMALFHRGVLSLLLLVAVEFPVHAFSPTPIPNSFGSRAAFEGNFITGSCVDAVKYLSSSICASGDDNENYSKYEEDEDEGEDDKVDIITQRLRRNAETGPINPMKEHAKMVKENEDEANFNALKINGDSDGAPSTLYSQMLANAIDPDFDPDVSTDEAYIESQFKELLSRKGEKLSRLGPGIALLPLDVSSSEAKSEDNLANLEVALQLVIEEAKSSGNQKWDESNFTESRNKQTEILERAHKLQLEIDQLHVDDCGAVLLANLGFYEAFSLQDPEAMKNIWWHSPSVMCIHPSHPPLIGSSAVFESFTNIFENGIKGGARVGGVGISAASGGVFMTPSNIRGLSVRGTTASLVCDEEVYSKGSAGESASRQGGVLINKLLTTNVFRKIGTKWKMVHRHASWHPETSAAKAAMNAEPGVVLYDDNENKSISSSGKRKVAPLILRRISGDGTSKRPVGLPSIPTSLKGLDAKAVLGIPLPKKEEPKKPKKGADGIISKIINLSDLLGGGSDSEGDDEGDDDEDDDEDDDDDEDKGIGEALADMLMGSADSDKTQITGSGTPDDPFITRRIIKIGPDGIQNLIGKKNKKPSVEEDIDEEEEEEPKNVVIDLSGKSKEERKEVLAKLVDNVMRDAGLSSSEREEQALKFSALDASVSETSSVVDREGLRHKCIATLRKLSEGGLLSSKQKRVLLTDIITSSARGETSMVETAYELLCTGTAGDHDIGMEDFTEQCQVFASAGEEDR
jgi:hypothetical protein